MAQEVLANVKELSLTGNEDLEMAHAYLGLENYDQALVYAMKEYARRPANIEVNEVIATIHYQKGDYENAFKYIKAGKIAEAKKLFTEAVKNQPNVSTQLFSDISNALAMLQG